MNIIFLENINQLRKCGCNPNTFFVLNALISLYEYFLDDYRQVLLFLLVLRLAEIHKHCDKRSLSVCGKKCNHLILDSLYTFSYFDTQTSLDDCVKFVFGQLSAYQTIFFDYVITDFFARHIDKRSQMRKRDRLSAILIRCHLCYYLCGYVAGCGKAVRSLYHGSGNNRSVLEHILKVNKVAVVHMLSIIIRVVEMNNTLVVSFHYILRKQYTVSDVARHLTCHIVTLSRINYGILIRVFLLCLFVIALYKRKNFVIRCIRLSDKISGVSVCYISLSNFKSTVSHNLMLDHVLHFFDRGTSAELFTR